MSITVFLGPSLPPSEAKEFLDADFRPPAAQGDLYNAASEGTKVIALIDGYFEQVPAVWHKEVLWAMKEGIHVYGASSMGALRAAELAPFGMTGIGHVYEAFATCELEDDDEVAVTHGPRELGYPITSEAMVNIRTTFAKAAGEGTISEHTAATLTVLAKRMYYPSRTYAGVIAKGREARLPEAELNALEGWLPTNKVDQKAIGCHCAPEPYQSLTFRRLSAQAGWLSLRTYRHVGAGDTGCRTTFTGRHIQQTAHAIAARRTAPRRPGL